MPIVRTFANGLRVRFGRAVLQHPVRTWPRLRTILRHGRYSLLALLLACFRGTPVDPPADDTANKIATGDERPGATPIDLDTGITWTTVVDESVVAVVTVSSNAMPVGFTQPQRFVASGLVWTDRHASCLGGQWVLASGADPLGCGLGGTMIVVAPREGLTWGDIRTPEDLAAIVE